MSDCLCVSIPTSLAFSAEFWKNILPSSPGKEVAILYVFVYVCLSGFSHYMEFI